MMVTLLLTLTMPLIPSLALVELDAVLARMVMLLSLSMLQLLSSRVLPVLSSASQLYL
jgi:hypothetical protein